ncbi:hypothetical protein LCGC14_0732630 [marine sediment metagenome]|uniref:Uncharacterized protein n=1 Tax=marine sediment metagenome TaxID=412755 RepID=A0A0F9Q948_9ZZZZ
MKRGWAVELFNGVILRESDLDWKKVPKNQIARLSLFYDGRVWNLSGKEAYFVKYRASMVPGIQESFRIERRTIGFYEGAKKICYHVDESTGKFNLEVIDNSG